MQHRRAWCHVLFYPISLPPHLRREDDRTDNSDSRRHKARKLLCLIIVSWGFIAGCITSCPAPVLFANGNLMVYSYPSNQPPSPPQSPSNLGGPGLYNGIFGFMALGGAIAIVVVYLAVRMDRQNQPRFDRVRMEPAFCANCRTPAVFGTRFCAQCGHEILETPRPSKDAFGV